MLGYIFSNVEYSISEALFMFSSVYGLDTRDFYMKYRIFLEKDRHVERVDNILRKKPLYMAFTNTVYAVLVLERIVADKESVSWFCKRLMRWVN